MTPNVIFYCTFFRMDDRFLAIIDNSRKVQSDDKEEIALRPRKT